MTQRPRAKRPTPERTEPNRGWSTLISGSPTPAPGGHDGPSAAQDGFASHAEPAPGADAANVDEGVGAGYRVIEEYLRQGQEAARGMWASMGGVAPAGFGAGPRSDADWTALTEQMLRTTTEMLSVWSRMLGAAMPRNPHGFGQADAPVGQAVPGEPDLQPAEPAASTPSPMPAPMATLSLDVCSNRRVEIRVQLAPSSSSSSSKLRSHDLRSGEADTPRLRGVRIDGDPAQGLTIALNVPDDLPAGVYTGLLIDDTNNLPAGTLSARIHEAGCGE